MEATAIPSYFSTRHFAMLGRLVAKNKPDVASDLIATYFSPTTPAITDYNQMDGLYLSFSGMMKGSELGNLDQKRLYVAVMLRLYNPKVASDKLRMQAGFVKNLSLTLNISKDNISRMIRQVVVWEKSYDDFEKKVNEVAGKIMEEA